MRVVSGKILWVEEIVVDKVVELRPVPIQRGMYLQIGTKSSRQRLFALLRELNLVHTDSNELVGISKHFNRVEKLSGQKKLKTNAKTLMQLSAAIGLESMGVMGQQCFDNEAPVDDPSIFWLWFTVCAVISLIVLAGVFFWPKLRTLEQREIDSAQDRLANHYGHAARLGDRLD